MGATFKKNGLLWQVNSTNTAWKVSPLGVILVCIFPHSHWMRRGTEYLTVFSSNAGKYGPE